MTSRRRIVRWVCRARAGGKKERTENWLIPFFITRRRRMVRRVCRARAASHGRAPAKLAQRSRLRSSWALLCASHASTRLGSLRTFSRTSPSARVSLTRCSIRRVVHMPLFFGHMPLFLALALHATRSFFAHGSPAVFMFFLDLSVLVMCFCICTQTGGRRHRTERPCRAADGRRQAGCDSGHCSAGRADGRAES